MEKRINELERKIKILEMYVDNLQDKIERLKRQSPEPPKKESKKIIMTPK